MPNDEPSFTGYEASAVQEALGRELGLGPEEFPLRSFIGMISDEIEQLRAAGRDYATIAGLISTHSGETVTPEQVRRYYASLEQRGHFGGGER